MAGKRGARVVLLVACLLGGACSDDERVAAGETPAPVEAQDADLDDPSLLSFLPAALEQGEGTFAVLANPLEGFHLTAPVTGSFWVTPSGNIYTRVDVDRSAVDPLIDEVIETRDDDDIDPLMRPYLYLTPDYYRGDEFQLGFVGLLDALAGPWSVFAIDESCTDAVDALAEAFGDASRGLEPEFVPADGGGEVWEVPVASLQAAVEEERGAAATACEEGGIEVESANEWMMSIERQEDRVRVVVDPGIYTEPAPTPVLEIVLTGSERNGDLPDRPLPTSLFDPVSAFIVKIGECGALPWEYSNFMAGNSYKPPGDPSYLGPNWFATDYVCEEEVPDQ